MRRWGISVLVAVAALSLASQIAALTPPRINYQGRLTDAVGAPVTDDTYNIKFVIYGSESGDDSLWYSGFQPVVVEGGLFSVMLGAAAPFPDDLFTDFPRYLGMTLDGSAEMSPRIELTSTAFSLQALRADSTGYAETIANNSVDSDKIVDRSVSGNDLALATLEGPHLQDETITFSKIGVNGAGDGQVMKMFGGNWNAADDETGVSYWVLTGDVLYTDSAYGVARGGVSNDLRGDSAMTHVNLGTGCNTGSFGQAYPGITISGGRANLASASYTVVAGGRNNNATDYGATVGGGASNTAAGSYSVVGGGTVNVAGSTRSTVGGGESNLINGWYATIAGGRSNTVNGESGFVGGGESNTVNFGHAMVGAGYGNSAEGQYSAILGGFNNTITSSGHYSYLFGIQSQLTEDSTFMVDMPYIRFGDEVDGYVFPASDGEAGYVLTTDGNGQVSWASPAKSSLDVDALVRENQELRSLLEQLEERIAQLEERQ